MPGGTEFKGMATSLEDQGDATDRTKPDSTGTGQGDQGDKKSETQPTEEQAPSNEEALAVARAEKEEALRVAREALRQSEAAKAYVSTLTATLKDSAERIAIARQGGGANYEEQPSLQERLNEDPEAVLEEHYNKRTAPIVRANLENQAKIVRELAVSKLNNVKLYDGGPSLWERYGDEVDQFLGQFPDVSTRAAPDAYEAAIQWVRSKHIDEEITEREKARNEAEKRAFVEGPTAGAAAGPRRKVALTDVERAVAKGLNLTEEEYRQYKEG